MCARCEKRSAKPGRTTTLALAFYAATAIPITGPEVPTGVGGGVADQGFPSLIGSANAAEAKKTQEGDTDKWTCPMHPHYIADEFGSCPICGMDLVKLETGDVGSGPAATEQRSIVTISPEVMQNIGVRLGRSEQVSFGRSIRSYGLVEENERAVSEISARVEGWVEQLKITAVGDEVKSGQPLFKLYAPQLLISQRDYLLSLEDPQMARGGIRQLKSYGVQDRVLDELKETRESLELVPFYAERSGTISVLNLKEGGYVDRGMLLARIQDYSSVWLIVGVAEKDLSFISKGMQANVVFPNLPGRETEAKVDYIYPTVDRQTRTGRVRLVISNKDGVIRPGSYADVTFDVGVLDRIAVPSEAVLKNGQGRYVVVSLGEGRFEPRRVRIGLTSKGWAEVLSGVDGGEDIVVSGQFLIDSESALRESFHKLQKLQLPLSLLKLTKNEFAMVDHLVDAALYLHEALVDGYDLDPEFLEPAISIRDFLWPRYGQTQLGFILDDAVQALRDAQKARTESEVQRSLRALVQTLRPWVIDGATAHYQSKDVVMFEDALGRAWLQLGERAFNPYGREDAEPVAYPEVETDEQERETEVTNVDAAPQPGGEKKHVH
ncbi:MAG: hypothetical protein CBB68_04140 [Rhodospirillaceae bacterium TMED8]|nr:efflux transporter periplasmic adaptor subunit [Magnetovibrio sp.]OUT51529.1 MAG: hypothetical protein CBB68_04140 [Rhodospirillaceae bacterium TMED8]